MRKSLSLLAVMLTALSPPAAAEEAAPELAWALPAAAPQPRLSREVRLLGGDMPAGAAECDLIAAARSGDIGVAKSLLAQGARANAQDEAGARALHEAAAAGHWEIARMLLKQGADPNAAGADGNPPLAEAILNGHDKVVKLLLRHGARLEQRNRLGDKPLATALLAERSTIARVLIDAGARLDARSGDHRCIAELAAAHADLELLQAVLDNGGADACRY